MATKTKKIDTKKEAKKELMEVLMRALENTEYETADGEDFGFKSFSLVVQGVNGHDVCISLTTPKAGQDTYEYKRLPDDEEEQSRIE